jgi:AraC-like DNA-binding protein
MAIVFHSRPPRHPSLFGLVHRFWWSESPGATPSELILPTGRAQLIFGVHPDDVPWALVAGPRSMPTTSDSSGNRRLVGVAFCAGGTCAFFGPVSAGLVDHNTDLELLWGGDGERLIAQLHGLSGPAALHRIEQALVRRVDGDALGEPVIRAERAIRSGMAIGRIATEVGQSRARLSTRFRANIGFGLKHYERIHRFERTVLALRSPHSSPLATIAAHLGYADQAHLTREVRAFAGVTPGVLLANVTDSPNHLAIDKIFKT